MNKIRIVGDTHGLVNDLRRLVNDTPCSVDAVLQIGDLGLGFGQGDYWHNSLDTFMQDNRTYFFTGNHDNPAVAKTFANNVKSGIWNNCFVVAGAWSIDHAWRTPGISWWPDEELSDAEFDMLYEMYADLKPSIVFSHDCPTIAAKRMFFDSGFIRGTQYATRTASALQRMHEVHQPDVHIFGHWHKTMLHIEGKTYFMCLNELDYIDIDLNNIDYTQQAMVDKVTSKGKLLND
jgi:predicted phosphodiesterase